MNIPSWIVMSLLCLPVFAGSSLLHAWQEGQDAARPDQEVDVSEENYRRHMELGDEQLQRNNFPVTDYAGQAELQKMQQLPEASQRHLRDQLREIIVEGGPWKPADAQQVYPYLPSTQARTDAALRGKEQAAWEELVGQYHAREASIHAARQAGAGAQSGEGGEHSGPAGPAEATGGETRTASAGQPGLSGQPAGDSFDTRDTEGQQGESGMPGVQQSALEFLNGQAGSAQQQQAGNSTPAAAMNAGQTQPGQSRDAPAMAAAGSQSANESQSLVAQPTQQAGSTQDARTPAASQQAQDQDVEFQEQEGVLAIRDLDKARGLDTGETKQEEAEQEAGD